MTMAVDAPGVAPATAPLTVGTVMCQTYKGVVASKEAAHNGAVAWWRSWHDCIGGGHVQRLGGRVEVATGGGAVASSWATRRCWLVSRLFYCGNGGVVVVVCCVGGIAVSLFGDGATMSGDGGFQPKARPRFWIKTTMMMFLGRNIPLGALLRHRHLLVGSAW
jgi:hypothetical protein